MRMVGLSGGIACGKSSVSLIMQSEGIPVIDCDKIARKQAEKVGAILGGTVRIGCSSRL